MDIFPWIILAFWLIFLIYWLVSSLSAKKNVRESSFQTISVVRVITILVFVILFFGARLLNNFHFSNLIIRNPIIDAVGVIMCGAGIALAIWARVHIGRNWGMPMSVKEEPELVTSGPYKYIRHPIYAGALLGVLGSTLVAGLWWILIFLVYFFYFMYAATREEKNLTQKFPTQYPEYMKRTKMIIPFVV